MLLVDNFILFSIIVSAGIFTQSAAGFAAGLVIIPLMAYNGFGIPEGQAVLLIATVPQNILGLYRFRDVINYREIAAPALLRLAAVPAGLAALYYIDVLPMFRIRQLLGAIILMCVALLCAIKPRARSKLHFGWTALSFLSSGFFAGLTGTGGPMMVLWVQAHDWSTRRSRAFLFAMYLSYTFPVLLALWWNFGDRILTASFSVLVLMPFLLAISYMGLRFGTWLGRERLRQVTMLLLCVIGLIGICSTAPTK